MRGGQNLTSPIEMAGRPYLQCCTTVEPVIIHIL